MKHRLLTLTILWLALVVAACDTGAPGGADTTGEADGAAGGEAAPPAEGGAEGGPVTIAFSAPGADHGWLAAITDNAREAAAQYDDVEFVILEGTNDSNTQVTQVEQLIADDPDTLVILPHEGDALTPIALRAMEQGIPVVNVDREFSTPAAYRTWIGGDNYGIGLAAGNFIVDELNCQGNVVEIQGIAGISVTQLRSQGFRDAIQRCNGGIRVVASQPADFVPDKGLTVMEAILQGQPQIDAVYTHDDDMAEGVVAAIENAGRQDEMFVTGAGGSAAAMDRIAQGGVYRATFLYNPSMSASAVSLARLIALGQGLEALAEPEVPSRIQLPASTVTQENVEEFRDLGY
jgi:ribose transport system substrate-binding protein